MSGNWPAKVGAGLLILGIGALLRYALLNIDVPPELKLGSGFVAAAVLGAAALALKSRPERRAIYLALGGTAFAVAYLTAYAAYDFFHYLNDVSGLSLMVVVSLAAGLFAVSARAMSVAVLAMAGAYIAPKFAIHVPDPGVLYGYYLAASAVTFVMVHLRGWRPLIHLSFLFTLAGALFFAWTHQFYKAEHYAVMQPLLLALVALHLAMPVAEHRGTASRWLARFDMGYFLVLPLVAAVLTLKIAPQLSREGAMGLGLLALLWGVAAVVTGLLQRRQEATKHACVAGLLLIAAGALAATDIPWLMLGLALAVMGLAAGPRLGWSLRSQELLCGAAMLAGALHVVFSIFQPAAGLPFANEAFAQRVLAAALMGLGAWFAGRGGAAFGRMLGVMAAAWACLALAAELLRLHVDFLPQLIYGALLLALLVLSFPLRLLHTAPVWGALLLLAATGISFWAANDAAFELAVVFAAGTPLVFLWIGANAGPARTSRASRTSPEGDLPFSAALGLLPLAWAPWVFALTPEFAVTGNWLEMSLLLVSAFAVVLAASVWSPPGSTWHRQIWPVHFGVVSAALLFAVLFHIERGLWPVTFEVLALAYMATFVALRRNSAGAAQAGVVVIIAAFLVVQAMLLRAFGPDRLIMSAADILQMKLPAAVSLLWASLGAGLAWWGSHVKSRGQWSAGVALLALTALKLVLRDFGDLDQLGNILALIGAGLLFLAVAWFAPIPAAAPRSQQEARREAAPAAARMEAPPSPPPLKDDYAQTQPGPLERGPAAVSPFEKTAVIAAAAAPAATPAGFASAPAAVAPRVEHAASRPVTRAKAAAPAGGFNWLLVLVIGLPLGLAVLGQQWLTHRGTRHAIEAKLAGESAAQTAAEAAASAAQAAADAVINNAPARPPVKLVLTEDRNPPVTAPPAMEPAVIEPPAAAPVKVSDACTVFTGQLPPDYVLYAGGAYSGSKLGFQIDQSGHEATRFDVLVNQPGKKVVLALGAYEPSVWNIRWSPGTVVAGVLVSGYHSQAVAGLGSEVPVLNASYDNRSVCGYFYLDRDDVAKSDAMVRKLFGRSAQTYFVASGGQVAFGNQAASYIQGSGPTVDSFRDKNVPLAGQPGIEQLIREGKLRIATQQDVTAWRDAVNRAQNLPQLNVVGAGPQRTSGNISAGNAYVVIKPMRFPAGLYGAHSVTFLVAAGVPRPEGNPGHSGVYDMNQPR
ncbi:DUF2339 domain-containing protein [Polaromonas sp. YR568]|uniref:DUF2339 domain-containing protein n=1 Tax=Polaromonas sp. YR568 TaxID=1855301 RepID=UPI0015879CFB|nr:DUF2339 domain-containing protein [Polaromonas sp. YR568]